MPVSLHGFFILLFHLQLFFQPFRILIPQIIHDNFQVLASPNISATPTPQASPTPTIIVTDTPSSSPSTLPTATPTPTLTMAPSPTPTVTQMPTPTPTSTPTPTETLTPNPTIDSGSPTPTAGSASPVPTATQTPTPTVIVRPTATETPTATNSPTLTPTGTLTPTPTETPTPTPTTPPDVLGNDISYPQCGKDFPTGQDFGIVGVNGGKATTANPCLADELTWANTTTAVTSQAKMQLYVNTGNPGGLNTPSWPQNNTDPAGTQTANPYGTCDGSDSTACAWQYGWNRAEEDVVSRFAPAAQTAGIPVDPSGYPWWLDVETANTWKSGSDSALQSNTTDLEGMVAYFHTRGVTPGLYSTSVQWGEIVSTPSAGSSLNGLKNWRPGASDLSGAKINCALSPLTTGGEVVLTQYTSGDFDYDYACK